MKQFDANLIQYRLFKVKAECAWMADEDDFLELGLQKMSEPSLLAKYSYVEDHLSRRLGRDENDLVVGFAERYGGGGIGTHGGGGRGHCIDGVQVKGSGANILVGSSADDGHSHGTLNMSDGILEVINSFALSAVLPKKVIKCLALLSLGEGSAFEALPSTRKLSPAFGALLIREPAFRCAHLLSAPNFSPRRKAGIPSDLWRMRRVFKSLIERFPEAVDFVEYLGKCLQSHAEQLACARINRIAHGTITASNVALDGRWLDLTNSSFVPGGDNVLLSRPKVRPFFEEHKAPLDFVVEILYTYGKFTRQNLNPFILRDYYYQQYNEYLLLHFSKLLGLPAAVEGLSSLPSYISLFQLLYETSNGDSTIHHYWPDEPNPKDPLNLLLLSLFANLMGDVWLDRLQPYRCAVPAPDKRRMELLQVLQYSYRKLRCEHSFFSFIVASLLITVKRCVLPGHFYNARLQRLARQASSSGSLDQVKALIEDSKAFASWYYGGVVADEVCLYQEGQVRVVYSLSLEAFIFFEKGGGKRVIDSNFCWSNLLGAQSGEAARFCLNHYFALMQELVSTIEETTALELRDEYDHGAD